MKESVVVFNCRHVFESEDIGHILNGHNLADCVLLVVDSAHSGYARERGYRFVEVDFESPEGFIPKIREFKERHGLAFAGVVGIDNECQFESSRQIADAFGLDYFSRETLQYSSNKYLMKERFRAFGVPQADYVLLEDGVLKDFSLRFPVVLKPAYGVSSSFVFLCRSLEELSENVCHALNKMASDPDFPNLVHKVIGVDAVFNPATSLIVEEYVGGVEYSCDFSVFDGKVEVVRVVGKMPSKRYLGLFEGYHLINPGGLGASHGFTREELTRVCALVAESIGFSEGVFMLDFKFDGEGIVVLETSPRPGVSTFIHLMNMLYGCNSFDVLIRRKLGLEPPKFKSQADGLAVELISSVPGKIVEYSLGGLSELESRFSSRVLSVNNYDSVGDVLVDAPGMHSDLIVGYVLVELGVGANPIEVRDFIYDNTKLLIDDGSGVKEGFCEASFSPNSLGGVEAEGY